MINTNQLADWCLIDFAKSVIHNPQDYRYSEADRKDTNAYRCIVAKHLRNNLIAIFFYFSDDGCLAIKYVGSEKTQKNFNTKFKQMLSNYSNNFYKGNI